ncbi:hypothetical protein N7493_010850, partial [Penicillium malachiteum]
ISATIWLTCGVNLCTVGRWPHCQRRTCDHINSLASTLIEDRDYVSAATIHAEHLHDFVTAARLLCQGSKFADAARLLTLHGKQDQVTEIVDSDLRKQWVR